MSVRKRTWTTRKGETREAWIVDFAVSGSRHTETFERKRDADARGHKSRCCRQGHPHRAQQDTDGHRGRTEVDLGLRGGGAGAIDHRRLQAAPKAANRALSRRIQARATDRSHDPRVEDKIRAEMRSQAMTKRLLVSLGTMLADAQARPCGDERCRSLKRNHKRGTDRNAERCQRGRLKVGIDIPSLKEIVAHLRDR